jgi:SWI/SNF-related matrix-associated actin-dependent regulator 1 of chromatin subfamily A
MLAIPNKIQTKCSVCSTPLPVGAGVSTKGQSGWKSYCASNRCLPEQVQKNVVAPSGDTSRTLSADGIVRMPYSQESIPLLRAMPGARWDGEIKAWRVSLKTADRPRLLDLASRLRLDVADSLKVVVRDEVVEQARARAARAGAFPFQLDGVAFLAASDAPRRLLGDEMGTGKTVQALLALSTPRAIIVVPASLKPNWRNEAKRWRPDLRVTILEGRGSFRWPNRGEAVVLNPDILPLLGDADGAVPVDAEAAAETTLIADEAHLYKSNKAKRSERMAALVEVCAKAWPMTGTPLLNNPLDLWGMLKSFGLEREVFGSFGGFLRSFNGHKGRWGGYEFGSPSPEVPEKLRRIMLRRTRAEVLPDLPPKTRQIIPVGVEKSIKSTLDSLLREYEEMLNDGELPPFEKFSEIRAKLAKSRVSALIEQVETYEEAGEPVVVCSAHRAPIDALEGREGWAVITGDTSPEERAEIVARFQEGRLKGVGLTIRAGGVGLTLTKASHMIFVDLDWTPALNAQCEDRICRIGQQAQGLTYKILVSDHPLDLHVARLIVGKMALIDAAVERVLDAPPEHQPEQRRSRLPVIIEESEDEYEERVAVIRKAAKEVEKNEHGLKIKTRITRQGLTEVNVPPQVRAVLTDALTDMISACDGAVTQDGAGFSKPDVFASRWLASFDLETDDDAARMAWGLLRGYPGQLLAHYPELFKPIVFVRR